VRVLALSLFALALAAPAPGADGEPKKSLTAKGQAIAKSIVLKRSDLTTGFVPHKPSDAARPRGARCAGVDETDLTVIGDADSPDFSRDAAGVAVGSSASVYRVFAGECPETYPSARSAATASGSSARRCPGADAANPRSVAASVRSRSADRPARFERSPGSADRS